MPGEQTACASNIHGPSCFAFPPWHTTVRTYQQAFGRRWLNAGTKIGLAKSLLHYYSKYYIRTGKHHDTEYAEQRCAVCEPDADSQLNPDTIIALDAGTLQPDHECRFSTFQRHQRIPTSSSSTFCTAFLFTLCIPY